MSTIENKDKLRTLHKNLTQKIDGFAMPYNEFAKRMEDDEERSRLNLNLSKKIKGYSLTNEELDSILGVVKSDLPSPAQGVSATPTTTANNVANVSVDNALPSLTDESLSEAYDSGDIYGMMDKADEDDDKETLETLNTYAAKRREYDIATIDKKIEELEKGSGYWNQRSISALKNAKEKLKAPSKYDKTTWGNNIIVNVAKGIYDNLDEEAIPYAGSAIEIADYAEATALVKKVQKGETLSDDERNFLEAMMHNLSSDREDISVAYRGGSGIPQSLSLGAEMAVAAGTGGLAAGATVTQKGAKAATKKVLKKLIKEAVETAMTPSLIGKNVAHSTLDHAMRGEEYQAHDFMNDLASSVVSRGVERYGGKLIDDTFGKYLPKVLTHGSNKFLKKAGIDSFAGEFAEEYLEAIASLGRSYANVSGDKQAAEDLREDAQHLFSAEGAGEVAISVGGMTAFGKMGSTVQVSAEKKRMSEQAKKVQQDLNSLSIDKQLQSKIEKILSSSRVEDSWDALHLCREMLIDAGVSEDDIDEFYVSAIRLIKTKESLNNALVEFDEQYNKLSEEEKKELDNAIAVQITKERRSKLFYNVVNNYAKNTVHTDSDGIVKAYTSTELLKLLNIPYDELTEFEKSVAEGFWNELESQKKHLLISSPYDKKEDFLKVKDKIVRESVKSMAALTNRGKSDIANEYADIYEKQVKGETLSLQEQSFLTMFNEEQMKHSRKFGDVFGSYTPTFNPSINTDATPIVPPVEIVLEEQEKQADTPSPIVSSTPTSSSAVSTPEIDTEAEVAKANATFGKASNKDGNLYEVSAFVNGKNVEGALKGEVALTEDGKLDIENSKGLMFIPKGNGKYTSKAIPLTDTEYNSVTINNVFNKEQYAEQAVSNAKQAAQAVSLNELIREALQAQSTPETAENGVAETSSSTDVGVTDNAVENQVSYPTKKDGSIDYDNLTPEQEYSLTAQEYGDEVAQEDVKSYIEQYQSAIDNIQSQLDSKNGTNSRAKMREAMRKNQEKLEAWKALLKEEPIAEENAGEKLVEGEKSSTFDNNNKQDETENRRNDNPVVQQQNGGVSSTIQGENGGTSSNENEGLVNGTRNGNAENGRNGGTDNGISNESNSQLPIDKEVGTNATNNGGKVSELSDKIEKELTEIGISHTSQNIRLASSQEFHDAIAAEKQNNPNGWMVDVHSVEDYEHDICMLTEDGKAGIAVTPDGDIISVFSSVKGDHRLEKLMMMAIQMGGRKLDCYYMLENNNITGLPRLYAKFGFEVAATTPFAEEYAPEGYFEWAKNNENKIAGVAAMYIPEDVAINTVESYSNTKLPNSNAPVFDGENGYDSMLSHRDEKMKEPKSPQTPEEVVQQAIIDTTEQRADEATTDAVNNGTYIGQPYTELGKAEKDFHLLLQKYNIKNPREKVASSNFLNAVTEKIKKILPEAQREIMYVAVEYKKLAVDTKIQEQLGGRLMHIKNDNWEDRKKQSDEIIEKARVANNELLDFMRDNNDFSYEKLLITGPMNSSEYKGLSDVNKELSRKVINTQDEYFTLNNRLKEDIIVREKSSSKQKEKPTRIKYYVKNKQGDFVEAWAEEGKEPTGLGEHSLFKTETGNERYTRRTRANIYSVNENGEYVSLKPQEAKSEVEKRTKRLKREDITVESLIGNIKDLLSKLKDSTKIENLSDYQDKVKSLKGYITALAKKTNDLDIDSIDKMELLYILDNTMLNDIDLTNEEELAVNKTKADVKSISFIISKMRTERRVTREEYGDIVGTNQGKLDIIENSLNAYEERLNKATTKVQEEQDVQEEVEIFKEEEQDKAWEEEGREFEEEKTEEEKEEEADKSAKSKNASREVEYLMNDNIYDYDDYTSSDYGMVEFSKNKSKRTPVSVEKAFESISNLISRLNLQSKVIVAMNLDQLKKINEKAYIAEINGEGVRGFYLPSKHQIVLYVPNLLSKGSVENVILHEGIAHFGLRELLGEEEFNNFCKQVWKAMSYADKKDMMKYIGKKYVYNQKVSEGDMIAAAEEYVAHLAETPMFAEYLRNRNEQEAVSWINKKWKKVCDLIRKIFKKRTGEELLSSDENIMDALYRSYQLLGSNDYAMFDYYRSLTEQMSKEDVKVGELNEEELFSKGRNNVPIKYINNKLSESEKMDIRIKLNYMDKTGRSLIKVGDSLYLLDHTDREGIANRGKLDGFGVVAKLNVEGLDEEQINYIKQEYYAGRIEGTQRGFKNWIERAKYDTRLEDSSRIDAKDRKANIDNVRLDSETHGRKSRREQGSEDSYTNLGRGSVKTNLDGTNGPRYVPIEQGTILFSKGKPAGYVNLSNKFKPQKRPMSALVAREQAVANTVMEWFREMVGAENIVTNVRAMTDVYINALNNGERIRVLHTSKKGEDVILGFEHNGVHYLDMDAMDSGLLLYELGTVWVDILKKNDALWERAKEVCQSTKEYKSLVKTAAYKRGEVTEEDVVKEVLAYYISELGTRLGNNLNVSNGIKEEFEHKIGFAFAELKNTLSRFDKYELSKLGVEDFARLSLRDIVLNTSMADSEAVVSELDDSDKGETLSEKRLKNSTYGWTSPRKNETTGEYLERMSRWHSHFLSRQTRRDGDSIIAMIQSAVEKASGKMIPEAIDVYNIIDSINSVIANRVETFEKKLWNPLRNTMDSMGKKLMRNKEINSIRKARKLSTIEWYLRAKDIVEYSEIHNKDRGRKGLENVLGMTLERYIGIVEGTLGQDNINSLWDKINEITNITIKNKESAGVLDATDLATMKRRYYIPEKGFDTDAEKDGDGNKKLTRKSNRVSSSYQKERSTKGRGNTVSDSPSFNIFTDMVASIQTKEHMRLNNAFYGLIEYAELYDEGIADRFFKRTENGSLIHKEGGDIRVGNLDDKNYLVFNETKLGGKLKDVLETNPESISALTSWWKGWVSKTNTAWRLSFAITNLGKDLFQTIPVVYMKYGPKTTGKVILNLLNPVTIFELLSYIYARKTYKSDNESSSYFYGQEKLIKEFFENGVATGYLEYRNDDDVRKAMGKGLFDTWKNKYMESALGQMTSQIESPIWLENAGNVAEKIVTSPKYIGKAVRGISDWSEIAARYALYKTLREDNYSMHSARMAARNTTMNLGRDAGGKIYKTIGRIIPFYRATVNAGEAWNRALFEMQEGDNGYKKALRVATMLAPAVILGLFTFNDDDDDKEEDSFIRTNNFFTKFFINNFPVNVSESYVPFLRLGNGIKRYLKGEKEASDVALDFTAGICQTVLTSNTFSESLIDMAKSMLTKGTIEEKDFDRLISQYLNELPLATAAVNMDAFGNKIAIEDNDKNDWANASGDADYIFRAIADYLHGFDDERLGEKKSYIGFDEKGELETFDAKTMYDVNSDMLQAVVYQLFKPAEEVIKPLSNILEQKVKGEEFSWMDLGQNVPVVKKSFVDYPKTSKEKLESSVRLLTQFDNYVSHASKGEGFSQLNNKEKSMYNNYIKSSIFEDDNTKLNDNAAQWIREDGLKKTVIADIEYAIEYGDEKYCEKVFRKYDDCVRNVRKFMFGN